jgi:hypothetical protein
LAELTPTAAAVRKTNPICKSVVSVAVIWSSSFSTASIDTAIHVETNNAQELTHIMRAINTKEREHATLVW